MRELLWCKIVPPALRHTVVARSRLTNCLDQVPGGNLILISAPAGYGKSTLLAQWLAAGRSRLYPAWLTLDPDDNDPDRFLSYLAAALERAVPQLREALNFALSREPNEAEADGDARGRRLTPLLNALAALDRPLVVVLDDYHVITARAVHRLVASLLTYLPETVRVVLVTRVDPPLPLARLRAQGQLTTIRAADLRFSVLEANEFFTTVMELRLSPVAVSTLVRRTEGWITGLQLAALSLQQHAEPATFLQEFAGDNHNIRSYLVDEVLAGQTAEVRQFLLVTSILERLSAPLCEALLPRVETTAAEQILESLEARNLFVVPLDEYHEWYRYHTLFAELLRFHLWSEQRDKLPLYHRRAAAWLEEQGFVDEAIRQAVAAGDSVLAETIRFRAGKPGLNGRLAFWLQRFRRLPLPPLQRQAGATVPANGHLFARGAYERPNSFADDEIPRPPLTSTAALPEPLSEREGEVLLLLAEGLSYQEIGQRLFISLPTVKTHISHVYGKLGVHSREEALARAAELRILIR